MRAQRGARALLVQKHKVSPIAAYRLVCRFAGLATLTAAIGLHANAFRLHLRREAIRLSDTRKAASWRKAVLL